MESEWPRMRQEKEKLPTSVPTPAIFLTADRAPTSTGKTIPSKNLYPCCIMQPAKFVFLVGAGNESPQLNLPFVEKHLSNYE